MDHDSRLAIRRSPAARAVVLALVVGVALWMTVIPATAAEEDEWQFETTLDRQPDAETWAPPARQIGGTLTVDLSLAQLRELQRLDENDRRGRLGLPANCIPALTAVMPATSRSNHLLVTITCTKTP